MLLPGTPLHDAHPAAWEEPASAGSLTVHATPLRATCFLVGSTLMPRARISATNSRTWLVPLWMPRFANGADEKISASSAKKPMTAAGSRLFQASSKASAVRNSSALASPWEIKSRIKCGSRFSLEAYRGSARSGTWRVRSRAPRSACTCRRARGGLLPASGRSSR